MLLFVVVVEVLGATWAFRVVTDVVALESPAWVDVSTRCVLVTLFAGGVLTTCFSTVTTLGITGSTVVRVVRLVVAVGGVAVELSLLVVVLVEVVVWADTTFAAQARAIAEIRILMGIPSG